MKKPWSCALVSLGFMSFLALAGCASSIGNGGAVKEQGVYTTLAMDDSLVMPGSGTAVRKTFEPGEKPAAVVAGYGEGGPRAFTLEVSELDTATVISSLDGTALPGKVAIFNLPVRKAGHYRLRLLFDNSVYDTWDFTVNGEAAGGATAAGQKPEYAQGVVGVSLDMGDHNEAFAAYASSLDARLLNAVVERARDDRSIFAQLPPGKVLVTFELSDSGIVTAPAIVNNTLTEPVGKFFLRVINDNAPFPVWAPDLRQAVGTSSQTVTATLRCD